MKLILSLIMFIISLGNVQAQLKREVNSSDYGKIAAEVSSAIYNSDEGKLKSLIETMAGKQYIKHSAAPLIQAVSNNNAELVEILITAGADINARDEDYYMQALLAAVEKGNESIMRLLIKHGAQIPTDENKFRYLTAAIRSDNELFVEFFLKKGIPPKIHPHFPRDIPILMAARTGNLAIVELLIHYGADIHQKDILGRTVLFHAAMSGSIDLVNYCLNAGLDVHSSNTRGETVLTAAIMSENAELVLLILNKGAKIHQKTNDDLTPAMTAAGCSNVEVMRVLIARGADIHHQTTFGKTALNIAVAFSNFLVVQELLDNGVSVNEMSNNGYTPLMVALVNDSTSEVVDLLLKRGADNSGKGKDGITALHLATEKGYEQILAHLLQKDK